MKGMMSHMKRLRLEIEKENLTETYTETTSKGNQVKYTNGKIWVKENLLGYEDIAETFISSLLKLSTLQPNEYVDYKLCKIIKDSSGNSKKGCFSNTFLKKGESHITLMHMFRDKGISLSLNCTCLGIKEYL